MLNTDGLGSRSPGSARGRNSTRLSLLKSGGWGPISFCLVLRRRGVFAAPYLLELPVVSPVSPRTAAPKLSGLPSSEGICRK